jgi:hypothetical protein
MDYEAVHTGASIGDEGGIEAAMKFDDRLSDEAVAYLYGQLASIGYPVENPYSVDEAEQDDRRDAHTEFLRQYMVTFAEFKRCPLTPAEERPVVNVVEARFGLSWAPPELVAAARCRRQRVERAEREATMRREHLRRLSEDLNRSREARLPRMIEPSSALDQAVPWHRPPPDSLDRFSCCGGAGRRPVPAHAPPLRPSLGSVLHSGPVGALAA